MVEFTLLPSIYATMVVRELTKQDTSAYNQASLCKNSDKKRDASVFVEETDSCKKIKLNAPIIED